MGNLTPTESLADIATDQAGVLEAVQDQASWAAGPIPDLEAMLRALAPLPSGAVLLGVCEDGLPLLLDMRNPTPGSLLLVGDLEQATRELLRNLLASIVLLHGPGQVELHLVAASRKAYLPLLHSPGALTIHSPYDRHLPDLIHSFAKRANQRTSGRGASRLAVLGIEDLEAVASQLSEERVSELAWLAVSGPQQGFWVFAGLDASRSSILDTGLIPAFPTRLAGSCRDPELAGFLAGLPAALCRDLEPGGGYCVNINGESVRFWLPGFSYPTQPERRLVKGV